MAAPAPLSAVVVAEPRLLADALSRVLRMRGVDVRGCDTPELHVDLAVVGHRGLPDRITAGVVVTVDDAPVTRVEDISANAGRWRIRRVADLEHVLDLLR